MKYIDMPLQHASASVLKRMKRGANGDIFLKLLEKIRAHIPGVAIRTSFIVGFPGETDADFEELCQFVQAAQFDRLGVFSYSDEDTARATISTARWTPHHPQPQAQLMAIQKKISRARNRKLIGQEFPVLVEGRPQETDLLWECRMPSQAPEIDGVCYINDLGEGDRRARAVPASPHHRSARLRPCRRTYRRGARHVQSRQPETVPHPRERMKCPICKKPVEQGMPDYPFCSERCRLIDLGAWASEKYVISTPIKPEDELETDLPRPASNE